VPRIDLDREGRFAFAWLPAGAFVVRIVRSNLGDDAILAQSVVRTDGSRPVDLGDLARTRRFDVALHGGGIGPPTEWGPLARVQWLADDGGPPVFFGSLFVRHGTLSLPSIAPGRYRVQRIEPQQFAGTWGLIGPPTGDPVEVVVDGNGIPTPREVW
jgi:hypothetical protein